MASKVVKAEIDNWTVINDFIEQYVTESGCDVKTGNLILISAEEIYTNIASYAYDGTDGEILVSCEIAERPEGRILELLFQDTGRPYDPLRRPEPDFDIPFEERPIGGLGVYMVKQFMDQAEYRYEDGCNILVLRKVL